MKKTPPRRIAILGMYPGWQLAFDRDDWTDLWACNDAYRVMDAAQLRRVTAWWEVHDPSGPLTNLRRRRDHWRKIAALNKPVYTCFPDALRAKGVRDVRAVNEATLAAVSGHRYFTVSFSYMIALALHQRATSISLYGTALTGAREALVERPCVEFWRGIAIGRGVPVEIVYDRAGLPAGYGTGDSSVAYAFEDRVEREATWAAVRQYLYAAISWGPEERSRLDRAYSPRRA